MGLCTDGDPYHAYELKEMMFDVFKKKMNHDLI